VAGKSFFGRIMGRNQSETQAAVPMSQVNSAPQDDKTYEFNTRLGSSYLNVVNYGTKCTAPYSTEEITRMARDPMQYISELRQWAKWAYYSNGTVTTAIDSLVSLHSLDYVVVVKPKKAGGSRKGYRASMDKMTSVLRSMRYKEVIRDGLFHDANEGMYVGYMETRTVSVDDRLALTDLDIQGITEINSAGVNCVVISLPVEYTRIIGRRNNCYEVAFDLRYFSAMTEGDRKRPSSDSRRMAQIFQWRVPGWCVLAETGLAQDDCNQDQERTERSVRCAFCSSRVGRYRLRQILHQYEAACVGYGQ
jgi:hypothetical protein